MAANETIAIPLDITDTLSMKRFMERVRDDISTFKKVTPISTPAPSVSTKSNFKIRSIPVGTDSASANEAKINEIIRALNKL